MEHPVNLESNNGDMNNTLQILEQFKNEFLKNIPEWCNEVENLTLGLQTAEVFSDNYAELYRRVHNLKGSGGSYGIPIISTICHQFEDLLNDLNVDHSKVNMIFVDTCLNYIDLTRSASEVALSNNNDFSNIENKLTSIRNRSLQKNSLGLIVDSSQSMIKMCTGILSDLPVKLISTTDGLVALERLLKENFDFLIMGQSLKRLDGEALLAALRASHSRNKNIKVITISSASQGEYLAGAQPDMLLKKDKNLADNLINGINSFSEKHGQLSNYQ